MSGCTQQSSLRDLVARGYHTSTVSVVRGYVVRVYHGT
jgi:hypothetical protein